MKILFHIDEEEKWGMVLENIKNTMAYGREHNEHFHVAVVVNGPAVMDLIEENATAKGILQDLQNASGDGVKFCGCNNAFNKFNPDHKPLCSFVTVVPAGIIEVAKYEQDGYAYVKP